MIATIPLALADSLLKEGSVELSTKLKDQALQMIRQDGSRSLPWYEGVFSEPAPVNEMINERESRLGSPLPLDCGKLEFPGLEALTDTVKVGPGADRFFSLGTCGLAVSATVQLVPTWQQIKTALNSLVAECITHPLKPPVGGRAYFNPPGASASVSLRRYSDSSLNGLNALPPHTNITLFRRAEIGSHTTANLLKTCAWQQVIEGGNVNSCL